MYKPHHPILNLGSDKNTIGNEKYLKPAVIAGGASSNVFGPGYGAYGQGTTKDNISTGDIKDLDRSRVLNAKELMKQQNDLAIKRDWCKCIQCGTILGGLALAGALGRR